MFRLLSDVRMGIEGNRTHGRHTMIEGEKRFCALSWTESFGGPQTALQAEAVLERTGHFWRSWLADGTYPDHPWRKHLQRSALVLKGLTFMPTGALVAAPTTSLPETRGGERNWDYRYCWMRDASFTLWALHALGLDWEADDFIQYVADVPRNEDGSLQIMYGVRGEKDLTESTLEHLDGYEGARPVRIGNGAYRQRQNDVFGAVLDSVYLHATRDGLDEWLWPILVRQVDAALANWIGEPSACIFSPTCGLGKRRQKTRGARGAGADAEEAGLSAVLMVDTTVLWVRVGCEKEKGRNREGLAEQSGERALARGRGVLTVDGLARRIREGGPVVPLAGGLDGPVEQIAMRLVQLGGGCHLRSIAVGCPYSLPNDRLVIKPRR